MARNLALAALAAATLLGPVTPAAQAAADSQYAGGCGLDAVSPLGLDHYTGNVYAAVVVFTAGGPTSNPVAATVRCDVTVNDVSVTGATFAGTTAIPGDSLVQFDAADSANVEVCTTVDFADATPTVTRCGGVLSTMVDSVNGFAEDQVEALICLLLTILESPPAGGCPAPTSRAEGKGPAKRKHKDPVEPEPPDAPYRPQGTIEISQAVSGAITMAFSGFVPPIAEWDCTTTVTSASCTPPAPPAASYNVCGTVTVAATSTSPGRINGTSACASGPNAAAASDGPMSVPGTASASPAAAFPWTCSAISSGSVVWTVRCTVG